MFSLKSLACGTLLTLFGLNSFGASFAASDIRVYEPETRAPRTGRVHLEQVRLSTAENDLAKRTTAPDIAAYLKQAEIQASQALRAHAGAATVMVHFTCVPGRCEVGTLSRGELSTAVLQDLQRRMVAIAPLKTTDTVQFSAQFDVQP
jgi:hypothetical protein